MVLNGIVRKLRTGSAWREVPERYGSWATLCNRFRRRAAGGIFERMLRAVQPESRRQGAALLDHPLLLFLRQWSVPQWFNPS
ncbi:transposase [Streptomyces tubercidicus]|uniref:transposase n=1 Tax=Streptomyces tubercidicus TaxID=47759 RepID=UPI002E122CFD|nr:transposase [Streptomyces tubercidicus]WSX22596.1 transposase [Streptomyces tubercidicus]